MAEQHQAPRRRQAAGLTVTEAIFQSWVLGIATWNNWLVYHTHDSRRSEEGFPDLVLVRERVVYAELKRPKGKAAPAQVKWIEKLRAAGAEVYLWYPDDLPEVKRVLAKR